MASREYGQDRAFGMLAALECIPWRTEMLAVMECGRSIPTTSSLVNIGSVMVCPDHGPERVVDIAE